MPNKKQLSFLISAALGLGSLLAMPVFAQDSAMESEEDLLLEEVIVTGTRIKTVDGFGRTSPVTVVDMQEIESFGYTRVEDFLNTLPQVQYDQSSFISNGASGTASVDLRGLGAERNLVLINGRRVQPGGVYKYAPDINQIPAQMIERVEVLTGGASATYGADAVAGVVNFIMRRVDGVEVNVGMSGYQHDNRNDYIQGLIDERGFEYPTGSSGIDGKNYNISVVIGGDFADGRGNASAYATWRSNEAMLQEQRDYSSCALSRTGTYCGGSGAAPIPNFWIAPLTEDGWGPYGYDYFQEEFLVLQPDSSLRVDDWRNPSNLYNYAPINFYMRPDERWSLGAFVDYEINPHAVAYLETMFTNDGTTAQIAEGGVYMVEVYPLQLSNAYFPENFRQSLMELWPGADDFGIYIGKRNVEGGPRQSILNHSSFRIVTGLRGALTDEWEYDMSYLYGRTGSSGTFVNDFLKSRIAVALDSRLCEAEPGCIPYEVFTYQGVTEAAAASLAGTGIATADTSTTVIQAYVTGTAPWGLPAGDIMAAAGFEHREVDFDRTADTMNKINDFAGGTEKLEDIDGGYSVNEIFLEANVPLLANLSFARNMTMDLAYRWSDYSTSGPSSTYRAGLDWQILEWLRFRTGYNRAVRAPNIEELFKPQQLGFYQGSDPCEGAEPFYSFEQCARTGVTAQQYGHIDAPPFEYDWSLNALYGGNPDLDPEKADTLTAGLVFDIGDAMQLSVDYWDILVEDAIEDMEPAIALDQCALYGNLCDLVHRAPGSGSLWRSKEGYIYGIAWNLGELHYRGIDVAWNWSPGEHWQMDLIGTWYLKKETTVIPNDPDTAIDCVGLIKAPSFDDPGLCWATPKWRHTATLTYDSNSFWSLTGRWRYFSKITYDGDVDQIAADNLGAQNYLDVSTVFRFMETHDLTLGVNNVLDKEPPMVGAWLSDNANSINMYDLLGRFLFANLTLRW